MKSINIKGTVVYQSISTGFWGIIDQEGNKWQPIEMPDQLKYEGKKVIVKAQILEVESIFMWGQTIRIIGFETMNP